MVTRQKVWIDSNVQGVLVGRVILYWTIGIVYAVLGSACFQYYQYPDWNYARHLRSLFGQFWPWIPSLILFMPLVIHDIVRMSNLFVGPIYRLRMHLKELLVDRNCRPLTFREDDYWQELVIPINCLQTEILELRAELEEARRQIPTTSPLARKLESQVAPAVKAQPEKQSVPEARAAMPVMGLGTDDS